MGQNLNQSPLVGGLFRCENKWQFQEIIRGKKMIIRNSARCLNCNDEIESKHRHDFVVCSCFEESQSLYAIWQDEKAGIYGGVDKIPAYRYKEAPVVTGIGVDGGHEYLRRIGKPELFHDTSVIDRGAQSDE